MKISARNVLKAKVTQIVKGATTSHVRIDTGGGAIVTASITNDRSPTSRSKKASRPMR